MQRRKYLAALGSLAAGGAAMTGTGAFTSVNAERTVDVSVADDSNALLAINPESSSNADDYVDTTGGTVSINIPGDAPGAGVNRDATTIIRDLLTIQNQGTEAVYVWVEDSPDGLGWFSDGAFASADDPAGETQGAGLGVGGQPSNWPLGKSYSGRHLVGVGETLGRVGTFVTDPAALESDTDTSLTIWAATLEEIAFAQRGAYDFATDPAGALPNNLEGVLTARDTRRGSQFPGSF